MTVALASGTTGFHTGRVQTIALCPTLLPFVFEGIHLGEHPLSSPGGSRGSESSTLACEEPGIGALCVSSYR